RQARAAEEAEKQAKDNTPPPAEANRSREEIARETEQVRGGEEGQGAKRNAAKALEEAQAATNPQDRARAEKKAADALRDLADRVARRKDEAKPADRPDREEGANAPRGMPTKAQSEQARQLAREERELRDAVKKAAREERSENASQKSDPLGELAKQ